MCDFKQSKSGAESWFPDIADASVTGECLAVSFCAKGGSYASQRTGYDALCKTDAQDAVSKDGLCAENYKDEAAVVDLMCTEDVGDIEMALWESRRAKIIKGRITEFFDLYEQKRYTEAVDVGVWVMLQDGEDKVHHDTALFRILKQSLASAMNKLSSVP